MKLKTDDELSQINSVYLGPKGNSLPFQARYICYVIGLVVFLVLLVVERKIGIGMSLTSFPMTILWTVVVTTQIGKRIDYERPLRALFRSFRCELTAARPAPAVSGTVAVPRLRRLSSSTWQARMVGWVWRHTHRGSRSDDTPTMTARSAVGVSSDPDGSEMVVLPC